MLVLDDENAYEYLSENRAGCLDNLSLMIEKRIGKTVDVTIRRNDSGISAKETVPDLSALIDFEIEEEN